MGHQLGLVGDVMLGRNVDERQRARPPAAVWGDVRPLLEDLDGLLGNLECALSTRGRPWRRTYRPFHFRADPEWAVPAIQAAGFDVLALANNHLMDYGSEALVDTLDALDAAAVAHAGAGRTREAARQPASVAIDGLDVAVVSFTDNTPEYAAEPDAAGVAHNALDPDDPAAMAVLEDSLDRARRADPDLLVASVHWGPNMRTEPLERHVQLGRRLAEQGVDIVHGHSAHVFQGVEVHEGALIVHDAGDFVDDYAVDETMHNDRGFLLEVRVDDGRPRELRLRPTEIADCTVTTASGPVARWSRGQMRDRSARFGTTFERDGEELVLAIEA